MEAGTLPRVAPAGLPTLTPRLLRLASDPRLVGLVREGRDAAFEAIYDRHHRGILSFCRHMLSDADEAEDAAQHTFMAAYSDLLTSDKPIHLRAWLFTIARNRCYTILRRRREHAAAELEESSTEGLASEVQRRQDLRDLVSDMRQFPEEQRAALVLAELDSLSHQDIAEVLGVPREKVKALVFQARESLLASRSARDTACSDIREQLAFGRGATLRRANLRRHLRECDGCRAYRAQVDRQRKQFAVLLPVVPGIALKEAIFSGTGTAGATGAISGGAIATSAVKGGAIKGIVAVIAASVSTAGTLVVATGHFHMGSLLHTVTHTFDGGPSAPRHVSHDPGVTATKTAPASVSISASAPVAPVRATTRVTAARPVTHTTATVKKVALAGRGNHVTVVRLHLKAPRIVHHPVVSVVRPKALTTAVVTPNSAGTPAAATTATPAASTPAASTPAASSPTTTITPKVTIVSTPSTTRSSTSTSGPTSPGTIHVVSVSPSSPVTVAVGATRTGAGSTAPTRYRAGSGGPTSDGSGSGATTTSTTATTATGTPRGTGRPRRRPRRRPAPSRTTPSTTTTTTTTPTTGTSTSPTVSDIGTSTTGTTSTTPATPGRTLANQPPAS